MFLPAQPNQLCLAQLEMTLGLGGAAVPHCSAMSDISKDPTYGYVTKRTYVTFSQEGHKSQPKYMYQNNQMTNS